MNRAVTSFVIDTSVAIKWFLNEVNTDKAEKLRSEYQAGHLLLVSPDLMPIELANALYFSGRFTAAEINRIVGQLKIDILIEAITRSHIEAAVQWMFRFKTAIYDLLFLALAQELQAKFITADIQFYNHLNDGQTPDLTKSVQLLSTF